MVEALAAGKKRRGQKRKSGGLHTKRFAKKKKSPGIREDPS